MKYYLPIILPLLIYLINLIFKKNNFISNYSGERHQKFLGKNNIPLSGGIFLTLTYIFIFYNSFNLFCIFLFLIFLLGLISDINFLSSPRLRFFLQSIAIFIFVYLSDLHVGPTGINLLDFFLDNIILSYIFTVFCFMIVINGSNFIDGLNGLVIGYYLIIIAIIFNLGAYTNLGISESQIFYVIFLLSCLFLFNLSNQLFMGDGGAYALGFIVSFFLIEIYQNNQNISAFYIVLLLWYPCFENLFSIIRKFRIKKSPMKPDNKHFHQLLFFFLKKDFKFKNNSANNLSSLMIIFYNLIIFVLASLDIYNTQYQILLIVLNIIIYIFFYVRLFKIGFDIKSK